MGGKPGRSSGDGPTRSRCSPISGPCAKRIGRRNSGSGALDWASRAATLHSYRYAWAERSADAGYPERYAQRALGQNSKIVHRAYAKKAQGTLPSLEDYEEAQRKAEESGKIVTLDQQTEEPKVACAFQISEHS